MIHICTDGHTTRPLWPTEQRWDCAPDKVVRTDCCYRRLPASETICCLRTQELPKGGYGCYQYLFPWLKTFYDKGEPIGQGYEIADWFSFVSYYDPTWRIECNPEGERSCKQHKRFLRGLHLREPL